MADSMSAFDLNKLGVQTTEVLNSFLNQQTKEFEGASVITNAFLDLANNMSKNPEKLMQQQLELYQSYLALWANMAERALGNTPEPVINPTPDDRRFSSESWEENLMFDYMKQSYLITSDWMLRNATNYDDMPQKHKDQVAFYTQQFLNALSPSNFAFTNPDVLKETIEQKGQNLVNGLQNMLADIRRGNGKLQISMTDYDAFEVGKNIGITKGEVVFKNRLIELIQYKPVGEDVHETPLLIVPPWINRFYILDLQEKNSFVKYAVEHAKQQTFMISWKNPDETYKDVGFEDYMKEGFFEALQAVLDITGHKEANTIGYCIGGTMVAAALAVMAKNKDKRVNSCTFFTTLIDFAEPGELSLFTQDEQVSALEAKMDQKGYLDGRDMASTFSMLRSNDLIWNFVVNNYLMGKTPFPFDLLYWNDDSTRMPAAMHSYYLRNMYVENNLAKKDKLTLCDTPVDITQIDVPLYMVTGNNDHITPWQSCFAPLHKMKAECRLILSKAGHVAGVVYPHTKTKGHCWVGPVKGEKDPVKWQKGANQFEGSWWPDWKNWIENHAGKLTKAPKTLGNKKYKALYPAPGTYVKE